MASRAISVFLGKYVSRIASHGGQFGNHHCSNIIVVERARADGVSLTFLDHARCGVPITVLFLAAAALWLWALGAMSL